MNLSSIFLPAFVQILLTLVMLIILGKRKINAARSRNVDLKKASFDNSVWPEDVLKVSNNITNQFQLPVLFYILVCFFYMTEPVTTTVLVLSWSFVVSRAVHAYIHTGSNYVPTRFKIFVIGLFCILILTALAIISVVCE